MATAGRRQRARALDGAFVLLFVLATLTSSAFETADGVSVWWLPAALLVGYLLRVPLRRGVAVGLTARWLASLAATGFALEALPRIAWSSTSVLVYAALVALYRRTRHGTATAVPRDTVLAIALLGVAAPVVAALVTRSLLAATGVTDWATVLRAATTFAVGDATAILTVVPLIGCGAMRSRRARHPDQALLTGVLVTVGVALAVAGARWEVADHLTHALAAVPVLLAATLGGGRPLRWVLAAVALTTALAFPATPGLGAVTVQAELVVLAAIALVVASVQRLGQLDDPVPDAVGAHAVPGEASFHRRVVTTARRVRFAGLALVVANAVAASVAGWDVAGLPLWVAVLGQTLALGCGNALSVYLDARVGLGARRRLIESAGDVAIGLVMFGVLAPLQPYQAFPAVYVAILVLVAIRVRTVHAMCLALVLGGGTTLLRLVEPFPWPVGAPAGDVRGAVPLVLASLLVTWTIGWTVEHLASMRATAVAAGQRAAATSTELSLANAALRVEATEHRRTAARLEVEGARRERSREAYEQFATIVAHDLKGPLASVSGIAQVLRMDLTPADTASMLTTLRSSVDRAVRFVDRLYDHARSGTIELRPEPTDLTAAARNVVADLDAAIGLAGATVVVDPSLPTVPCDPVLVAQLLTNVVSNALVHGAQLDRGPAVTIEGDWEADGFVLRVSDDGPGVPPEIAGAVFTTGVRSGSGTGLGLGMATCRTIAERHGGWVRLETTPGGGCTVAVLLPAAAPLTSAVPTQTPTGDSSDVPRVSSGSATSIVTG